MKNAFVFCNRKREVAVLHRSLVKHGFNAVALHGDMPQSKRNEMLAKFKAGEADMDVGALAYLYPGNSVGNTNQ